MRLYFKPRHINVYAPLDLDYARTFLTCATIHSFLGALYSLFCIYTYTCSVLWININALDQIYLLMVISHLL